MQGELGMRNIISAIPMEKPPAGVFQQYPPTADVFSHP